MPKQLPTVKVQMSGVGRGKVWVDGVEIPWVRAVRFTAAVDQPNKLEVEICGNLEVEGPAEVLMRLRDQLPKLRQKATDPAQSSGMQNDCG